MKLLTATLIALALATSATANTGDELGHTINLCNTTTPYIDNQGNEFHVEVKYAFPSLSKQIGKLERSGECHSYTMHKNVDLIWESGEYWNPDFLGSKGSNRVLIKEQGTSTINFEGNHTYVDGMLIEKVNTYIQQ